MAFLPWWLLSIQLTPKRKAVRIDATTRSSKLGDSCIKSRILMNIITEFTYTFWFETSILNQKLESKRV